jgi:hypothetical protein
MAKMLEVTSRSGRTFKVDISDKACRKFGCRHGDVITDPGGNKGKAMGVAPSLRCSPKDLGPDELWYVLDGEPGGRASYWSGSLEDGGFKVVVADTK